MSTKSLTEAFEVKPKIEINNENVKDYEDNRVKVPKVVE